MQSNSNSELGTEPVGRLLLRLALPAICAQLVNMLYNIVDRIFIGHIPDIGADALTGVGVTFPVILLISAFSALVGMGGAPRASIALGEKKQEQAENILGNCFAALIAISVLLTAFFLIFQRPLLLKFGADQDTIVYATDYLRIYVLGTIFVQIALGMNGFITAQGKAGVAMATVCIGAIINIILDPILIFGFHLGVRGAAIATVLSQMVSAMWVLRFLNSEKTALRLRRKNFRIQKSVLMPCVALGLSPFVMQSTESLLSITFNVSLLEYGGKAAVGAMTILTSLMQIINLPLLGIGRAASRFWVITMVHAKPDACGRLCALPQFLRCAIRRCFGLQPCRFLRYSQVCLVRTRNCLRSPYGQCVSILQQYLFWAHRIRSNSALSRLERRRFRCFSRCCARLSC